MLCRELSAAKDFRGLVGELSCNDFGDCGTGHVYIFHHTDSAVTNPAQLHVVYSLEL